MVEVFRRKAEGCGRPIVGRQANGRESDCRELRWEGGSGGELVVEVPYRDSPQSYQEVADIMEGPEAHDRCDDTLANL